MEKYKVIEGKMEYPENEVRQSFNLSSSEVLEILGRHPEVATRFKEYIPGETFRRLSDPEFQKSEEYAVIAKNIDAIGRNNDEAFDQVFDQFILGNFSNSLQRYLEENDIEVAEASIEESIKKTHMIPLDLYRYEAVHLKNNMATDSGTKAFYVPTYDCLFVSLYDTEFGRNKLSEDTIFMLHCEVLSAVLSHELLHSLAYQNLWDTRLAEDSDDNVISDRRSGIVVSKADGTTRLLELNEAVTQKIAIEVMKPVFTYDPKGPVKDLGKFAKATFAEKIYKNERVVLDVLLSKVSWKTFLDAYFKKHEFLDLSREIKKQFGVTLRDIADCMKKEKEVNPETTYEETKTLLGLPTSS